MKLKDLLNETKLKDLIEIEPYNDPDDEYGQDLDSQLEDEGIDWQRESKIMLLNPNDIEPSEWNHLSDDPNNKKSLSIARTNPNKIPPILVVKSGSLFKVIDGIHRVYAFRKIRYLIPAIVMTKKLENSLATTDYKMVSFMNSKYQNSIVPTPKKF